MKLLRNALVAVGATVFSFAASAQTFTLCEGQKSEEGTRMCGAHDAFAGCGLSMTVAREKCVAFGSNATPRLVVMRSQGGNQCGYTVIHVICG